MAGPNDIGALRGIIGDGQSMNDEDVRTKAYGKRPGSDNKLTPVKVPTWDPEKHLTFIQNGQRGNAMDVFAKFNIRGQDRKVDSTIPHVVNKILHDRHAFNNEEKPVEAQQEPPKVETISIPDNIKKVPGYVQPPTITTMGRSVTGVNWKNIAPWSKGKFLKRGKAKPREYALAYTDQYKDNPNKSVMQNLKGQIVGGRVRPQLLKTPQKFGQEFKSFAGDLADNLGKTFSSGALVGPYKDPNEEQKVSRARLQLQAYLSFLQKKYKTNDVRNSVDPREQYKLTILRQQLEKQQKSFTQSGFMSGGGGVGIVATSQPRMNFNQPTTPRIQFSELGQGLAYPEAASRLGVQQNMASGGQLNAFNQNKWDVMLNRSSPDQKIFNILGKAPDPLGKSTGESAQAKIKRLSGL